MARRAWMIWWGAGLVVPFVQLPSASVEDSGWIAFAVWVAAAGWLGLWTPRLRAVSCSWLAWLLAAWVIHPLCVSWPVVVRSEWVDAWQLVAHLSASGCLAVFVAFGTASVLERSPAWTGQLAVVLSLLLAVNVAFQWLQHAGLYSRWLADEPQDLGGLFSSKTVSSAWCVVALPLLLSLRGAKKLCALPALYGVLHSGRTTVFVAVVVWLAWRSWPWVKRHPCWVGAALAGFVGWWWSCVEPLSGMVSGTAPRLATWPVILNAILANPLGIGWSPIAYHDIVRTAPHPIMGHPSSSVLAWVLSGGWGLGVVLASCAWWGARRLSRDGLSGSLVVCAVLALIQRTMAQAQVGALAWALVSLWLIQRNEKESTDAVVA